MRGNEVDLALGSAIAKELVKRGIKRERLAESGVCIDAFAINRCADAIEEGVRKISELPVYPKDGAVFGLTIAEPFTGLRMVRDDGFAGPWHFTGEEITAPQTKRFKLVSIGYQPNFEAVRTELAKHGKIPQGQWRKAFKKAYPKTEGSQIGVADSSWVGPNVGVYFPYVGSDGDEGFSWPDGAFGDDWRWLVEVE